MLYMLYYFLYTLQFVFDQTEVVFSNGIIKLEMICVIEMNCKTKLSNIPLHQNLKRNSLQECTVYC